MLSMESHRNKFTVSLIRTVLSWNFYAIEFYSDLVNHMLLKFKISLPWFYRMSEMNVKTNLVIPYIEI